jgi:hypothetical protein
MGIHARTFALTLALGFLTLPTVSYPKGADGLVLLQGRIQHASRHPHAVSFEFTGKVSFSFFSAPPGNPARKRIDLEFDVRRVLVRIPDFGGHEYDNEGDPFRVIYKNAVEHAMQVSQSGEKTDITLIEPVLSYGLNGLLREIGCARGQVLPIALEQGSRTGG